MRVNVLLSPKGEVLATFRRDPEAEVQVEPEIEKGCRVAEIEVEDDDMKDLSRFYEHCRKLA